MTDADHGAPARGDRRLRSLLFVPADRPERIANAAASGADAIILDLEDSVSPERKPHGREAAAEWLSGPRTARTFVRINPLDGGLAEDDIQAVAHLGPDGVMLPKAEGAASIERLLAMAGDIPLPPILPIATETASSIFELGSYRRIAGRLAGLAWGAEDLSAAVGAATAREEDGSFTPPYQMVRSLTLFASHAACIPAIESIFPYIDEPEELKAFVATARRDGFTGMMAIHPAQVEFINAGFTPTEKDIARARAVLAAFRDNPGAGALKVDGRMIDRPHLILAQRILAAADAANQSEGESGG